MFLVCVTNKDENDSYILIFWWLVLNVNRPSLITTFIYKHEYGYTAVWKMYILISEVQITTYSVHVPACDNLSLQIKPDLTSLSRSLLIRAFRRLSRWWYPWCNRARRSWYGLTIWISCASVSSTTLCALSSVLSSCCMNVCRYEVFHILFIRRTIEIYRIHRYSVWCRLFHMSVVPPQLDIIVWFVVHIPRRRWKFDL